MSEEKSVKCRKYNEWGECVEWTTEGGELVGRLDAMAKSCSPELYKEAEKNLREGKVKVRLN